MMLDLIQHTELGELMAQSKDPTVPPNNSFLSPSNVLSENMKHPSSHKEEHEFNIGQALELRCKNTTTFTACGQCETCALTSKIKEFKEWFFRFGDHSKKRFMLGLLRRIRSVDLLKNLITLLQPVVNKDQTYARARTHPSLKTDVATISSDRAMNSNQVEQVTISTWEWFSRAAYWTKMNFSLNLLQKCDAHLIYELYMQARTLLASEIKAEETLKEVDPYEAASIKSTEYSYHSIEHPQLELLSRTRSVYTPVVVNPFTGETMSRKKQNSVSETTSDEMTLEDQPSSNLDPLLLVIPTSAKAYAGVSQYKDFIRCLPVHLAKMILSMLDMVSLYNALCVSPNWRKLADEVKSEIGVNQQLREEVMLMQGAAAHSANPVYANDIDVLVPDLDPNTHEVIPSGDVIKTTFKSEMNFGTAYSGIKTKKVIMEERNVYCGAYNVMVVVDGEDPNRVMHTDGSQIIALGSKDRKVRFIDCTSGKETGPVIIGHAGSIRCCYLMEDQGKVLSGSYDTSVRCWSIETGQCLKILRGHQDTVMVIVVLGDVVATGAKDHHCKIWNLQTGKCQKTFKHQATVLAVALSQDICISGCEAGKVKVWELVSGNLIKTLAGHHEPVTSIKFDRWHIVTGSKDGYVLGWSAVGSHSRCIAALRHPKEVLCLEFTYLRVITGSADGRVRIWNLITGQCCRIMRGNSRSDPILSMVAIGDRITVNTLNSLLVMNFEKVHWDYSLQSDQVPPLVQYGSYSDAPVRSQPYPYIRAQRMSKAGATNSKIVHHDHASPDSNTRQVLLQQQYRATQLPHSAKSLSSRSLYNARCVQSMTGISDGLPSTSETAQTQLSPHHEKACNPEQSIGSIKKGQHSVQGSQSAARSRVHSTPSQFSVTIKEQEEEKEPLHITRRISWAFEKPLIPRDKNISLSEIKALLRSQMRMKTERVVPPDFIYLTVSTIQKSINKSETNFNTKRNMQDWKPDADTVRKRPSSSPSRIDPRTKVPVEELGLESFMTEDGTVSEFSDKWSVKTKEQPKTDVVKTKECYSTVCMATPVLPGPHASLHPIKVKTTVPPGWVIRPISAGPLGSDGKTHMSLVPQPPRPITAPGKTGCTSIKSIPASIAPSLAGVGGLLQRPKPYPLVSTSQYETSNVPMLMYPKEVKEKAAELMEGRKYRHGQIEIGPEGRAIGRVSIYNQPMREHVKFELRTHLQEEEQMAQIKRQHEEQGKSKLNSEERKKRAAWLAMASKVK